MKSTYNKYRENIKSIKKKKKGKNDAYNASDATPDQTRPSSTKKTDQRTKKPTTIFFINSDRRKKYKRNNIRAFQTTGIYTYTQLCVRTQIH